MDMLAYVIPALIVYFLVTKLIQRQRTKTNLPPLSQSASRATIVVLLFVIYLAYTLTNTILPDLRTHSFPSTQCLIHDKKLEQKNNPHFGIEDRISFYVSYLAENKTYQTWGYDRTHKFYLKNYAENIFKQYEVNKTYPCWYDPNNPENILLTRNYNFWPELLPLGVLFIAFIFYLRKK